MKLTELTFSCSRKFNLGNYEMLDVHYSAKAEVGKDKPEKVYDELRNVVNTQVGCEILKWEKTAMATTALANKGKDELKRQVENAKSPF